MFLEMSEKTRNKEITFREAERIKDYVLEMMYRVPAAFTPKTYREYAKMEEVIGYFNDVRELKNLYIEMEIYLSRKESEIEVVKGMSLRDYNTIYNKLEINKKELDVYVVLQEKFNTGVNELGKHRCSVADENWEELAEKNNEILKKAKKFADEISEKKEYMEEQHEDALFRLANDNKVNFWSVLDDMPQKIWHKVETDTEDKVKFYTEDGKLLGFIDVV